MHSFTLEDLVQYMYKESSREKTIAIKTALETDWNLREKYEVVTSAQKRLQTLTLSSPRKKAVDEILSYAKRSAEKITTEL